MSISIVDSVEYNTQQYSDLASLGSLHWDVISMKLFIAASIICLLHCLILHRQKNLHIHTGMNNYHC